MSALASRIASSANLSISDSWKRGLVAISSISFWL
jgi:hypothetical protein